MRPWKRLSCLCIMMSIVLQATQTAFAQATLVVSNRYSAIEYSTTYTIPPNGSEYLNITPNQYNDTYIAFVEAQPGPAQLWVFDNIKIANNNTDPSSLLLDTYVNEGKAVPLPQIPSKDGMTVVFFNRNKIETSKITVKLFRVGKRPPEVVLLFKSFLETPVDLINSRYKVPKCTISVEPCGTANAYTKGNNIVICSELVADLFQSDTNEAIHPIILHEMSHFLLNAWGLPGYDNEDIADEFAVILLGDKSKPIEDFIKWLEKNDSVTEAAIQLYNGDRHTISIQRARNMKLAFSNRKDLLKRWEKLLTPYAKTTAMDSTSVADRDAPASMPSKSSLHIIEKSFVTDYLKATEMKDLEAVLSFYADKVDYYSKGIVPKNFIKTDKESYFKVFQRLSYSVMGDVHITDSDNPKIKQLDFIYAFSVQTPKKTLNGTAENVWTVQMIENRWRIIGEKQKVITRKGN